MSGHETQMSLDVMYKPDANMEVWIEATNQSLKIVRIWHADEGVLPPHDPH